MVRPEKQLSYIRGRGRGDRDGNKGPYAHLVSHEFECEHHAPYRGIERCGNASGRACGDQGYALTNWHSMICPRVEPKEDPIWTIGPSRPTEPPLPMETAEARAFISATIGLMMPLWK